MSEKLKKFIQIISENEELAKELQALNAELSEETVKEMIAIAAKYGMTLSEADFDPQEDLLESNKSKKVKLSDILK